MTAVIVPLAGNDEVSRLYLLQVLSSHSDLERTGKIEMNALRRNIASLIGAALVVFVAAYHARSLRADGSLQSFDLSECIGVRECH